MDGVTNLPYRMIVQRIFDRYNQHTYQTLWTWTEFMNADGYMVQPHRLAHHFIHNDRENNLIIQIYWWTKETLIAAAIDIDQKYGDQIGGIELNIGCPSPRVMACGGGSALMRDHDYLQDIVKTISTSITSPFSIKVRSWLRQDDKQERFDTLVSLAPFCKTISIHGRTFKQWHSGDNDWGYIRHFKQIVSDQCLVVGNGGIKSYEDMGGNGKKWNKYIIDGYMVGQAAIGNPWIFTPHEPTPQDRYDIIIEHMHLLLAYEYRKTKHIPDTYEDAATRHNKKLLHARKKGGDIGDDTRHDVQEMKLHTFVMPMPTMAELDHIATHLEDYIDLDCDYQYLAEFRKYLFNYIAWLPGSKELKKTLAKSKAYYVIKDVIDSYFHIL